MTIGKPGDLAYFDSFAGLVPVKVLRIAEDGTVFAKVTARRDAYWPGQVVTAKPIHMVPRKHVVTRSGQKEIIGVWTWEPTDG